VGPGWGALGGWGLKLMGRRRVGEVCSSHARQHSKVSRSNNQPTDMKHIVLSTNRPSPTLWSGSTGTRRCMRR
jgi:hypothetical protein